MNSWWWDTWSCRRTAICLSASRRRAILRVVMQALKLGVVRRLLPTSREKLEKSGTLRLFEDLPLRHFWQRRFYDFNVWSARKRIEKLRYIHRKSRGPRQARFWLAG